VKTIALLLLSAFGLSAQQIPIWQANKYTWVRLSPRFIIANGALDVVLPPPVLPVPRVYGFALTCAANECLLPTGASGVAVWLNGIRMYESREYTIKDGKLLPTWSTEPVDGNFVLIDYTP
jgi:hypothetical protein